MTQFAVFVKPRGRGFVFAWAVTRPTRAEAQAAAASYRRNGYVARVREAV